MEETISHNGHFGNSRFDPRQQLTTQVSQAPLSKLLKEGYVGDFAGIGVMKGDTRGLEYEALISPWIFRHACKGRRLRKQGSHSQVVAIFSRTYRVPFELTGA